MEAMVRTIIMAMAILEVLIIINGIVIMVSGVGVGLELLGTHSLLHYLFQLVYQSIATSQLHLLQTGIDLRPLLQHEGGFGRHKDQQAAFQGAVQNDTEQWYYNRLWFSVKRLLVGRIR